MFTACILITLSISRILLIAVHWQRVEAVDGLLFVLLQGLRFDLILTCALILPPALLSPFLCHKHSWFKILQCYLVTAFLLTIFMEAATPTFISEYDLRPNILFVDYLKYPKEVTSMLLAGYKLDLLLGLSAVLLISWLFAKVLRASSGTSLRPNLVPSVVCSLIVVILCSLGIRSSFGHRPANPAKIAFSKDLLVNDLSLNSLYSVLYALYSSSRHEKSVQAYGRMEMDKVLEEIRDDMALPKEQFISDEIPTLHRAKWVEPLAKPMNLVIILQESLGAEFVGALGGTPVTPELDKLSSEGIWFDNLYATGTRSARGIEAVVTGFTPTPARSVVKLPKSQSDFFSIAELLKRRGYDTSFIYGGEAHFDNMRQFFAANGFDNIIEEQDFLNPQFSGSWGVSDGDLFQRAHQEFSKSADKPFFTMVFTSSNHSPFEFPENKIELYEQPRDTVNNAVKYADYAMGEFFRKAKQSNYWDNTLFLVVADHNSRVRGANLVPIEYFHIPALILGGSVEPQIYTRLASQIDLLPTLLGLMGIPDQRPSTGHDLFRPDIDQIPGRAIMQYNSTQAYMRGDDVVIMELDKKPSLYKRTASGLAPSDQAKPDLIDRALAYSVWSASAYQQRLYRLPKKEQAPFSEAPTPQG
ncbi:sulfatase-like hydrolase/transferase [Parahaliea sp. F7430]|uniref:Sulfatase-like hydrolase/transferase n=1 Tax=Sediminihaliea albiluteola TaxID=2758564 RepID=A0A7W2YJK0_9GAMM|nr:sulfatase-like hydrolase/transferase [Sediminihaliea albiluteola]